MAFPLAHIVQHMSYLPDAADAHGNPVKAWGAPVDVDVYGWATPGTGRSGEPKLAGRDQVVVDLEIYAPDSWKTVHAHDRVIADGQTFDVIGEPEDYNHGPFGWEPGIVVNLQRKKG